MNDLINHQFSKIINISTISQVTNITQIFLCRKIN